MQRIAKDFPDVRIGLPLIGAGLARGDWAKIVKILRTVFEGNDATVVYYSPSRESNESKWNQYSSDLL